MEEIVLTKTKVCTKCGCEKPLSEFYRDARVKKDGRQAQCKACTELQKQLYRSTHKKERSEHEIFMRLNDPSWREKAAIRNKRYLEKLKAEGGERLKHHKERVATQNKKIRTRDPRYSLWHGAKGRANKQNLEFNIDLEDIIIPEKCPILEIPICNNEHVAKFNSITLDRIDPTKGYVKGNVAVISRMANTMKNDATREELQTFCKNIFKYIDRKDIVRTTENTESVELEDKEPLG